MPIKPCLYCGTEVSVNADACPKCSNKIPFGVRCTYCSRQLRQEAAIECANGHACQECIERIFVVPNDFKCPDCRISLVGKIPAPRFVSQGFSASTSDLVPGFVPGRGPACPGCGNTTLFKPSHLCGGCGNAIYPALGQEETFVPGIRASYPKPASPGFYVHSFCARAEWISARKTRSMPPEKSGCFVATAAYGARHLDVILLQQYRDQILNKSLVGRSAVQFYHGASPLLARWIEASNRRRALARALLRPLVFLARQHLERSEWVAEHGHRHENR